MAEDDHSNLRGDGGILLRVENGVVIGYDSTGLTLKLSDTVVADLRRRLGNAASGTPSWIDPGVLGDIDAWNVEKQGGWYHFDAAMPGYDFPRRFRRPVAGGHIVADTAGPLCAVLSLGGARRARGLAGRAAFPAHVVCPADDIGAVGCAGVERAAVTSGLERAREVTLDTHVADALLRGRQETGRALPLILARCESDMSGSVGALLTDAAMENLEQAIDNLCAAASALGVAPRVLSVALDFAAEDVISDASTYIAGIYDAMARISQMLAQRGLHEPVFVMRSDETGARVAEHWHLSVFPGAYKLVFAAPGYAFAWDQDGRPLPTALPVMAEAEATAIEATLARTSWHCPRLLLAETTGPGEIRVTTDGLKPLILDPGALSCGADHGFAVDDETVAITAVTIDPDDAGAVRVRHEPTDAARVLHYADGRVGGLRDQEGRWALPARIGVGRC